MAAAAAAAGSVNKREMTLQWTVQSAAAAAAADMDSAAAAAGADNCQSLPIPAEYYEDEACSLVDSTTWHENDLILAAELGKALLERNRDLEHQLVSQRALTDHQAQEIELLARQVQTLRGLNDGKARMVEEVDRQCAELEAQNRSLAAERAAAKERSAVLAKQVSGLEARVEELGQHLERALTALRRRGADARLLRCRRLRRGGHDPDDEDDDVDQDCPAESSGLKKTASYPELACGGGDGRTSAAATIDLLSARASDLASQVTRLMARNAELQAELAHQASECERAKQEASRQLAAQQRSRCEALERARRRHNGFRRQPLKDADEFEEFLGDAGDLTSLIESDVQQIHGDAGCGQLESGGTVFSSEENLCRIGATKKLADTALAEISLLTELNDQYNRLVVEYEQLLAEKTSRVQASQTPEDGRGAFEQRLTGIFAEETRSERKRLVNQDYRPKYKDLFRDAMSKLRDMKADYEK